MSDSHAVHVNSITETGAIEFRPRKAKFLCPPVLLPSTLYYIRIFKYYICSFIDIASYKFTKIRLDNEESPVYSSSV